MDQEILRKSAKVFVKYWKPILVGLLVLAIIGFISSLVFLFGAEEKGRRIGEEIGEIAGSAAGSYDGWLTGYDKGKDAGMSAEDTTVTLLSSANGGGKLCVLQADILAKNEYSVGKIDENNSFSVISGGKKYEVLYIYDGQVEFLVDLKNADVKEENGTIAIELPTIETKLTIDEENPKLLAQYIRKLRNGSNSDGIVAYNNEMANMKKKTAEELENYDYLLSAAKESAKKQVSAMVQAVLIDEYKIDVRFKDEG